MEATTIEQYMNIGALGVSFLTLMGIVYAWVKSIGPTLKQMHGSLEDLKHESNINNLMLDNNTTALTTVANSVEEVAKSNENVAAMVGLLTATLDTQVKLIEKHDLDTDKKLHMALEQLRMTHQEIVRAVEKNGMDNDKQHGDITQALTRHDDRGQRIETELGKTKGKVELLLSGR